MACRGQSFHQQIPCPIPTVPVLVRLGPNDRQSPRDSWRCHVLRPPHLLQLQDRIGSVQLPDIDLPWYFGKLSPLQTTEYCCLERLPYNPRVQVFRKMAFYPTCFALIAILTVYLVGRLFQWQQRRQMIRLYGCQPIPKYPSTEPFGQDFDRAVKKSFQEGHVNRTAMGMYEKIRSTTYQVHTINDHVVHTCEPRNHHVIVTNMDDWHRDVRKGARPFTGVSLLTLHGAAWKQTRDLIDPLFKRAELKDLDYFEKFVDRALAFIQPDSIIDMQPLLRKLVRVV